MQGMLSQFFGGNRDYSEDVWRFIHNDRKFCLWWVPTSNMVNTDYVRLYELVKALDDVSPNKEIRLGISELTSSGTQELSAEYIKIWLFKELLKKDFE